MPRPSVSVVTVALNDRAALAQTLASVAAQEYADLEQVVVDGGSTDGTLDLLGGLGDPRVTWASEPDRGIYDAMNKGVRRASGDWIIFLNAGDLFLDAGVVAAVFSDPAAADADLVYGDSLFVSGDKEELVRARAPETLWMALNFNHNGSFTRRALLLEHPFSEQYRIVADSELAIWAYLQGKTFYRTPVAINRYVRGGFADRNSVLRTVERWKLVSEARLKPQAEIDDHYFQRLLWEPSCSDYLRRRYGVGTPAPAKPIAHIVNPAKTIAHIVNPVKVGAQSDLFVAQPVTFRAMAEARRCGAAQAAVDLCALCYPEDTEIVPDYLRRLKPLARSVLDLGRFERQRKLPLIKDVLDAAVRETTAEWIIYTNVDIAPMPFFYLAVAELTESCDALVINRRTIAKCEDPDTPLSEFYRQVGDKHPGFDCFVFRRDLYPKFYLGEACIGANWIGRVLICNLLAYAKRCEILTDAHLTFHLGDDRSWKTSANIDYDAHNEDAMAALVGRIASDGLLDRHPLLRRSYDEFLRKTRDPDPSRPKAPAPDPTGPRAQVVDLAHMPARYLPSAPWSDGDGLRQDPVFIVGHPRSGTTLLHSLVATQYAPAIFPETHFFSIASRRLEVVDDRVLAAGLDPFFAFLGKMLDASVALRPHVERLVQAGDLSPKMLFEALVFDQLARNLPADAIRGARWMEKTPDHADHMETIFSWYPRARFVFVVRNPEKAILSRRTHFTWNDESNWPIQRHAERWVKTMEAYEGFAQAHPEAIILVRHEDVVADQRRELGRICAFLGVDFDAARLDRYREFSGQQNLPWELWKKDTAGAISSDLAKRPERRMSGADQAVLAAVGERFLKTYGYEVPTAWWARLLATLRR